MASQDKAHKSVIKAQQKAPMVKSLSVGVQTESPTRSPKHLEKLCRQL